jgi:hypothetical protein
MSLWGDKRSRHGTESNRPRPDRRRHARKSGLQTNVSVRDAQGRVCKGTVLNVSQGGIGLFMEHWPSSEFLEIQLGGSQLWISLLAKHCSSAPVGYLVGCAFQSIPTPDILQALNAPRESSE